MDYIIGIDLGTGSAKAIAMIPDGSVIDTAQIPYPILQPQPGFQEQSPELIWQAFLKCVGDIVTRQNGQLLAICFSSAMHGVFPVDRRGEPLMNMMIWADNRSAAFARKLHQSVEGKRIYEASGTPIHPMTPLCKLQWLKENEPEMFAKADKFVSIKEYVWYKLFGVFEIDYSLASATGLMDIHQLKWNDESLAAAGIQSFQLSELVNTNHSRKSPDPSFCQSLGIPADTLFIAGASDGCLANVGSFATEQGYLALTIGTSGAVRVTRPRPVLNFKAMTFNYLLDHQTYVCGGPINNGGGALKWFAENLLGRNLETPDDYSELLDALRETPPGAEGLVFLPYILGERAPIWNSDASGVFFGMRGYHRQAHFTRAVVEGISASLYDITSNMIESGLDIKQIHVSGGFIHSPQWLQVISDLFDKKLCLVNSADASASGAVYLAMKELDIITEYDQLKPRTFSEYLPDAERTHIYQTMFDNYRKLYTSLNTLMI